MTGGGGGECDCASAQLKGEAWGKSTQVLPQTGLLHQYEQKYFKKKEFNKIKRFSGKFKIDMKGLLTEESFSCHLCNFLIRFLGEDVIEVDTICILK